MYLSSRRIISFRVLGPLVLLAVAAYSSHAQSSGSISPLSNTITTPRPFDPALNTTSPSSSATQSQNPFLGSVPDKTVVPGILSLSLQDAVQRALRSNLGMVDSRHTDAEARAARIRALAPLLPHLSIDAAQHYETFDENVVGGQFLGIPNRIGPYGYQAAELHLSQSLFNWSARDQAQAASQQRGATLASMGDAREIVVLAASSAYLQVASSAARVHAAEAQLETAKAFDEIMSDRVRREVSPELDAIRAKVALETSALRLRLLKARLEKDKLALTRIIGLPLEQQFDIGDGQVYSPRPPLTVETALETALSHRSDLKAEAARESAAAELVRARKSERLPTVGATASWGAIGINPGTMNGNYDVGATLRIPILTGGQIKADIVEADATLERRRAEYEDLKARVAFDVRNAFLDVDAADDSVGVSERNVELSHRGLKQAQDRFQVGLATNYEVIQAQEAVAGSEENLIASINAHNLAKLELIRALGIAEPSLTEYVKTQKLPDRQIRP